MDMISDEIYSELDNDISVSSTKQLKVYGKKNVHVLQLICRILLFNAKCAFK